MSFASKPFSALQRAPEKRANGAPFLPPWPRRQRREFNGSRGSRSTESTEVGGGARLSGWSNDCALQRWIQTDITFECWCAPPNRRRQVVRSAAARRTTSCPTDAALALVILPLGFSCPGPLIEAAAETLMDAYAMLEEPPPLRFPSRPETPPSSVELVNFEESKPLNFSRPTRPQSVSSQQRQMQQQLQQQLHHQQQKQRSQSPPTNRPQLERQRVVPSRPQSVGPPEVVETTGPREQLLRLARLSYTHSTQADLATRRLLRSALLHRSQESLSCTPGGSGNRTIGTGFLTRQRLPVSSEQDESQSNCMWQQSQCFLLPPIVPD